MYGWSKEKVNAVFNFTAQRAFLQSVLLYKTCLKKIFRTSGLDFELKIILSLIFTLHNFERVVPNTNAYLQRHAPPEN